MTARFHPAALSEFQAAARYYESKQKGLGLRFIDSVEGAILRFERNPLLFRNIDPGIRKCRVARFPYGIIFRERKEMFEIIAVMHLHREPDYWKGRV